MTTFVISFDLGSSFDQTDFFETLNSLGETQQATSSTWFLKSDKTAKEIRDLLALSMDSSERLVVLKSASPGAWRNVMCANKWLIDNVSNK
jgi:hypothetical protein